MEQVHATKKQGNLRIYLNHFEVCEEEEEGEVEIIRLG